MRVGVRTNGCMGFHCATGRPYGFHTVIRPFLDSTPHSKTHTARTISFRCSQCHPKEYTSQNMSVYNRKNAASLSTKIMRFGVRTNGCMGFHCATGRPYGFHTVIRPFVDSTPHSKTHTARTVSFRCSQCHAKKRHGNSFTLL